MSSRLTRIRIRCAVRVVARHDEVFNRLRTAEARPGSNDLAVGLDGNSVRLIDVSLEVGSDCAGTSKSGMKIARRSLHPVEHTGRDDQCSSHCSHDFRRASKAERCFNINKMDQRSNWPLNRAAELIPRRVWLIDFLIAMILSNWFGNYCN